MTAILAILLSAMPAFADPPPDPPPDRRPDAADATYFNISFQAQEALARADRQAAEGHWPAAVRALQEIGEKFGDSVIAAPGATDHRLVSVRDFINRKIAAWPPEGLAAYRTAFESTAKKFLDDLTDNPSIDAWARAADRFYAAAAGAVALDHAGQLAMEAGEFATARQWYERLLADHPDREQNATLWKAKLALCRARQGDLKPLESLIAELKNPQSAHRDSIVEWGGRRQPVVDFLVSALDDIRRDGMPDFIAAHLDQLGGGADRRGFFPSTASAEARWWRFTAFGRQMSEEIAEGYESRLAKLEAFHRALSNGRLLACQPVASPAPWALIFIHDSHSVWAINPQAPDRPVWQFDLSQVLPSPAPWNSEESAPPLYTSLYADGRLYVHLERDISDTVSEHVTSASSLVALDAANGALLWRNDLEGFVSPFEEARIDGAPLMHRGALYAVARRRKPFGFEACYLLRIDPDDGRMVWSAHLGEAATGSYGYSRATLTFPAACGELVIVPTNLGGITAVSTCTGHVAWVRQYESRFGANPDTAWPEAVSRPLRSWHYNSAIVWAPALGDSPAVLCFPLDSDELFVLSCDDGRELQKIPAESLHHPQTLLGLDGDRLFTAGTQIVCYNLAAKKIAWQRPLEHGQLFGRGVLTSAGLFLPTDRGLLRYPLDGGAANYFRWPIEDAGNLLARADEIVVAAPGALFGLVAKEEAFAKLDRRMKESPDDPMIAFSLAELAFNTGENQRGLDAVQAAVDRVGGFARLTDANLRRRFFSTLIRFATTLLEQPPDQQPEATDSPIHSRFRAAVAVLQLAGQCAPEPADQAVQCLMLARAHLESGNPADAIRAYQRILGDRGLRRLKIELRPALRPSLRTHEDESPDAPPNEIASIVAGWIARIVTLHGGEVYAPIARQAADRLQIVKSQIDSGEAIGKAADLLEVADAFPNSPAAHQALVTHAALMARLKNWTASIRSYRRALADPNHPDRPDLIRQYADTLVAAGREADAAAWLDRGARDFPAYRISLPAGPLSFSRYRRQLFGDCTFCNPAHAVSLGRMDDSYRRINPDRVAVLEPVFPNLPETRWDALLTYSGRQLEARHPLTARSLWSKPFLCATQPILIGMDAAHFVFATPYRLFALTRTSGQLAWDIGEPPPDDARADPESVPAYSFYYQTPRRLFSATDRGVLSCIDLENGRVVWENKTVGPLAGQLVADDVYCCCGGWQSGDYSITVLDAQSGHLLRQIKTDEKSPAQSLDLTGGLDPTGVLVVRTASIERFDPANGKSQWKITAPDHFLSPTLQIDADSLVVSSDGRRLTRYNLEEGRVLWRSSSFADEFTALSCQSDGGILYVASDVALSALDLDDGRTLWTTPCPAARGIQPPRLLSDRIITIAPESPRGEKDRTRQEPQVPEAQSVQYRITAYRRDNGRPLALGSSESILTEPLASFGGLYARDNALIVLDANRLIGYVARNGE